MRMVVPNAMLMTAAMLMPVMPQLGLVEQKEKHQSGQQRGEQVVCAGLAFKRFRQQVHESGGQQSTSSQTEHVLGVFGQYAKAQGRSNPDAADASG